MIIHQMVYLQEG